MEALWVTCPIWTVHPFSKIRCKRSRDKWNLSWDRVLTPVFHIQRLQLLQFYLEFHWSLHFTLSWWTEIQYQMMPKVKKSIPVAMSFLGIPPPNLWLLKSYAIITVQFKCYLLPTHSWIIHVRSNLFPLTSSTPLCLSYHIFFLTLSSVVVTLYLLFLPQPTVSFWSGETVLYIFIFFLQSWTQS